MRVLILLRGFDSLKKHEVGNFELDQAKALTAAGHDVRAVAVDVRSPLHPRGVGCYEYTADGIPVIYCSIPVGNPIPALQEQMSARAMRTALKRLREKGWEPDVVHAHFLSKAYTFSTLPEADRFPFVITEHSSTLNSDSVPSRLQERMRFAYKKADCVLAVGKGLAEHIRQYTGVEPRIVPNMLDTSVFFWSPRQRHESAFRFVTAGNLYRIKGFDILLDAMALLRDKGMDVRLTLIGGGDEEAALKSRTRRLCLEDSVRFTGRLPREQLAAIYRDADAFVLASRGETFGVAYIEAMAAGLPVVATRCGGPEDFVDNANGILVPPEDPAALAEGMERMVRTVGSYDGAAISAFAREKYSPEALAVRLTNIYEEIVKC